MCRDILSLCMYVHHRCNAHWGRERVSDPRELELKMFVSHQDGAGNQIWLSAKAERTFDC